MYSPNIISNFTFALALALSVNARATELVARADAAVAITGVHTGINAATGARPFRRNILDLQKDVPQWSLYVQALSAMQTANDSDPTSWFQVAGIHGRPYRSWNNAPQNPESFMTGYCPHGSALFPTWHRPYLALLEQTIGQHAQRIAKTYTGANKAIYQAAADNLRIPYWDWATSSKMPDFINTKTIKITKATGTAAVTNPLTKYAFQPFPMDKDLFPADSDMGLASDPTTLRHPDTKGGPTQPGVANGWLLHQNLKPKAYNAFVKATSFNDFGTTATGGPAIEGVHGNVHTAIGGDNGHMAVLMYSSFDPVFWLHHANVDRMVAMFQAAHPDFKMEPLVNKEGTFTVAPGSTDDINTPLKPFTSDTKGTFYTSATVLSLKPFGYAYPELEDWHQTPEALRANATSHINTLYAPAPGTISGGPGPNIGRAAALVVTTTREWSVALSVDKLAFDGQKFSINVFSGAIPAKSADWPISDTSVGDFPIFPPPVSATGPKPVLITHDEISLAQVLAAAKVNPTDVAATTKFLKEKLTWGIRKVDGTVVPPEQLKSLSVQVFHQDAKYSFDKTVLPTFGVKTFLPEVTRGKPGGK